jgi:putative ABC transport system permease protein
LFRAGGELEAFLASTLGPQRFRATVIAVCGSIGLLLATIGVYGVTTRSVLERRREIGIRLALGGQPRSVWWRVAATSLRAVAGGVVLGVIMSALAREGLAALLPEFEEAGLGFCFAAAGVLFAVGAIAAMAAARGAGAVDPLTALRSQ